jgi:DNA-binding transcriptional MocR family regulator
MGSHRKPLSLPYHPECTQGVPCHSTSGLYSSTLFYHYTLQNIDISSAANLPSDCINLGQGYMNFPPPQWVRDAADVALNTVAGNHYSHPKGRLRLREAIRDHYSEGFNRRLDVEDEILVTSGANEGVGSAINPRSSIYPCHYRSIFRLGSLP